MLMQNKSGHILRITIDSLMLGLLFTLLALPVSFIGLFSYEDAPSQQVVPSQEVLGEQSNTLNRQDISNSPVFNRTQFEMREKLFEEVIETTESSESTRSFN